MMKVMPMPILILKLNPKENEQIVDVDFQITKGELVYINHINISGNNITRDKVIRRQLEVIEGDLVFQQQIKKQL